MNEELAAHLNINARGPLAIEHARRYIESGGTDGATDPDGRPCLLLTTLGRRSGQPRRNVLIFGRDGHDYIVVASRGGDRHHPHWYLNLSADPHVQVKVGTTQFAAVARTVDNEDRERLWAQMVALMPIYAEFQLKTARIIPVVALRPATA